MKTADAVIEIEVQVARLELEAGERERLLRLWSNDLVRKVHEHDRKLRQAFEYWKEGRQAPFYVPPYGDGMTYAAAIQYPPHQLQQFDSTRA